MNRRLSVLRLAGALFDTLRIRDDDHIPRETGTAATWVPGEEYKCRRDEERTTRTSAVEAGLDIGIHIVDRDKPARSECQYQGGRLARPASRVSP